MRVETIHLFSFSGKVFFYSQRGGGSVLLTIRTLLSSFLFFLVQICVSTFSGMPLTQGKAAHLSNHVLHKLGVLVRWYLLQWWQWQWL